MTADEVLEKIIINAVNMTLNEQVSRIVRTPFDGITSCYYYSVILTGEKVIPVKVNYRRGTLLYYHKETARWRRLRI